MQWSIIPEFSWSACWKLRRNMSDDSQSTNLGYPEHKAGPPGRRTAVFSKVVLSGLIKRLFSRLSVSVWGHLKSDEMWRVRIVTCFNPLNTVVATWTTRFEITRLWKALNRCQKLRVRIDLLLRVSKPWRYWAEFHKTRASSTTVLKNCSTELHGRFKKGL
jgi:hypothetical protein